ncbi:SDR family oxidoreductase [Pseudoalteromonas piratica]|uniref:Short-chain dehydrogenase n=1 Tax=Pseudoalteromonas piratica TaxID=1348114 RepID=A0A0A7EED8_9GAMM|nr:SDR family oxidoreductase [Pseudoalteromonas piratica]AIY64431.1 short-chain dehydrogenase [Pseudoalteromonas piratica]
MSKHVVVTGANRGIGLAFVKQYISEGFKVTAVVRNASDELIASGANVISGIDVVNADDITTLKKALAGQQVDILINNAGVFKNESLADMDFASIEEQINVNAIAPIRVTHALQDNLIAGSKVAMITSRMGSIEDNGSGAYIGYRMSKAALNAASKSIAIELAARDISLAILHPGFVQTAMVGFAGDISPEVAASRLIERIYELNLSNTGTFWHSNGEVLPW